MDATRLAEIRAREQAATKGPWEAESIRDDEYRDDLARVQAGWWVPVLESLGNGECAAMLEEDAEFAAHSRQDVPDLLAYVDVLSDAYEVVKITLSTVARQRDEARAERDVLLRGMTWAHHELAAADPPDTLWLMDLLSGLLAGKTADQAAGSSRHDHAALDEHQRAERAEAERDVLRAAGNEMARVLDQEIMPRYQELFEAAGLGAVSLSVAVEDATRVRARWRRAAGLGEPER